MKIYLAGPMRGIPNFNFPAFFKAALELRANGHEVFNPAEDDVNEYGWDIAYSPTGSMEDIRHLGFSIRDALARDVHYICRHADTLVLLPGWSNSKGALAEKALAEALDLTILYY